MSIEYHCSKCGTVFSKMDAAKKHDLQHKASDRDLAKKKLLIKNLIKKALPEKIEGYNIEYLKKYATDIFSNLGVDLVLPSSKDLVAKSLTNDVYFNTDCVCVNIKEETPYILNDKASKNFKTKEDSSLIFYAKKIFLDNDKLYTDQYIQSICDTISYAEVGYRIRLDKTAGKFYYISFNLSQEFIKEIGDLKLEKQALSKIVFENKISTLHEMEKNYCEYFKLSATCDANIISLFLESRQVSKSLRELYARKEEISVEIRKFEANLYKEFSSSNDIDAIALKSGLDLEALERYNDICNKTNDQKGLILKISEKEVKDFAYKMASNCLNNTSWLP